MLEEQPSPIAPLNYASPLTELRFPGILKALAIVGMVVAALGVLIGGLEVEATIYNDWLNSGPSDFWAILDGIVSILLAFYLAFACISILMKTARSGRHLQICVWAKIMALLVTAIFVRYMNDKDRAMIAELVYFVGIPLAFPFAATWTLGTRHVREYYEGVSSPFQQKPRVKNQ